MKHKESTVFLVLLLSLGLLGSCSRPTAKTSTESDTASTANSTVAETSTTASEATEPEAAGSADSSTKAETEAVEGDKATNEATVPEVEVSEASAPVAEASAIISDPSLVDTDEAGDYSTRSPHLSWQVVDPDPNGLNCRMGDYGELEIFEGAPPTPDSPPREVVLDIGNWPPIGTLPTGQQFKTRVNLGGWFNVYDLNNKPWIFVADSAGGPAGCFVRANDQLVQPVP